MAIYPRISQPFCLGYNYQTTTITSLHDSTETVRGPPPCSLVQKGPFQACVHLVQPITQKFHSSFLCIYTFGKWGLDTNTEFGLSLLPKGVLAEVKCRFRMLAGPITCLWRTNQSITINMPFVFSYGNRNQGRNPSVKYIRDRLRELPWDEFVCIFFNI